jgi:hypothetical protein
VRFVNGIKAGEIAEVPSRRILAPAEGPAPSVPRSQRPLVIRIEREPVVGDEILWTQTGEIVWKVESLDADANTASVTGELFGKPVAKTLPLSELEVRPVIIEPEAAPAARRRPRPAAPEPDQTTLREQIAPVRPRRDLEVLLDDVVFSNACLDSYRQRFARSVRGPALNERLREEIRSHGYIVLDRASRSREYGRIRVEHRFDVILPRKPSPDDPVKIDALWFPRKRGAGKRGSPNQRRIRSKPPRTQ